MKYLDKFNNFTNRIEHKNFTIYHNSDDFYNQDYIFEVWKSISESLGINLPQFEYKISNHLDEYLEILREKLEKMGVKMNFIKKEFVPRLDKGVIVIEFDLKEYWNRVDNPSFDKLGFWD